jgi:peptidoglycan-associated lipoprotein
MKRYSRGIAAVAMSLIVLLAMTVGCSRKPKPAVVPATMETKPTTEIVKPPETATETPVAAVLELKDVFFDYDKFSLRDDAREALNGDGKLLVDNPGARALLEGHCDERGTVEYNLALGERRANATKAFLVQYGVDAARLSTISYGEERPFATGQNEAAWAQNRRVHFVKQ